MASRFLVGSAGVAFLAVAGVAQAADIPPLGAEAEITADGPKVTVIVEAQALVGVTAGSPLSYVLFDNAGVDVKFASGLGFSLAGQVVAIPQAPQWVAVAEARLYYGFGAFEVGFSGLIAGSFPTPDTAYQLGPDFRYEGERFTFANETTLVFDPASGFNNWTNQTDVTFNPNARIELAGMLRAGAAAGNSPNVRVEAMATITVAPHFELIPNVAFNVTAGGGSVGLDARFPLGAITPFVELDWDGAVVDVVAGVDLEKQIGTGPFSLLGTAQFATSLPSSGTNSFIVGVGIRYLTGDDPPDFLVESF